MLTLCWGCRMTDESPLQRSGGDERFLLLKGLGRIEADVREIRKDLNDLKSTVALKSDMYRILGLIILAATGAATVATFVLRT